MKGFTRNSILTITAIALVSLVVKAAPFEYEICNLGWKHVHHKHHEASYQNAWCSMHGGVEEYENKDFTRVDCLTDTHAVEFDFANKLAESIGQALHYGIMTGKKPKVVLILDEPCKQMVYFKRIQKIGKRYNIDTEYVTNDILDVDENYRCKNPKCKCHKESLQY